MKIVTRRGSIMDPSHAIEPTSGSDPEPSLPQAQSTILDRVPARTPARILTGRAGASYRTSTYLELAATTPQPETPSSPSSILPATWARRSWPSGGCSRSPRWPGRRRSSCCNPSWAGRSIRRRGPRWRPDASPVPTSRWPSPMGSRPRPCGAGPALLPLLAAEAHRRGWRFGQPFFIRHGRVGVLNDIGDVLDRRSPCS